MPERAMPYDFALTVGPARKGRRQVRFSRAPLRLCAIRVEVEGEVIPQQVDCDGQGRCFVLSRRHRSVRLMPPTRPQDVVLISWATIDNCLQQLDRGPAHLAEVGDFPPPKD